MTTFDIFDHFFDERLDYFDEGTEVISKETLDKHFKSGFIKVIGIHPGETTILFYCKDGAVIQMYHEQNCCETVYLESSDCYTNKDDIYTDCDWCEIEEVTETGSNELWESTFTWTFYKIKTNKGYDTLRWYGTSNGYYSERVDFLDVTEGLKNLREAI